MSRKQEALRQLVYEDLMEDRFREEMEVPIFTKKWEVALYLLFALGIVILGLLYLPFYLSSKLWNYIKEKGRWCAKKLNL